MPITSTAVLVLIFFLASAVGVVTGSNSLITVPAMFQFGIDPKTAVATNMFGLTFMNIGASISFLREGTIDVRKLSPLIPITLVASALGAMLVGMLSSTTIPLIVTVSMFLVVLFIIVKRDTGNAAEGTGDVSGALKILTYSLTFVLGIYGGIYSGGYVTMLTAVLVAFFGLGFGEAVAGTKLINAFSSMIATIVFAAYGLIDYKLGIILAVTMFSAAYLGAKVVVKLNDIWLRRIFLSAVLLLAGKTALDFLF